MTEDHALKVQLSADQIQTYLACGDIAGALDVDGALIVGMKETVYAGIAYFVPAADGPTNVSVMIAQVVGDEADGADSVAATASQATPAAPAATDASPQLVDVSLINFSIEMPTELSAGPVRFNIVNNGTAPHSFVLEGEGIRKTLANTLQPRDAAKLNADLTPGDYIVYCPVGEGAQRAGDGSGVASELRVLGDG